MSLADELGKLNATNEEFSKSKVEVDYPSSHLKNYPINFGKKNPTLHVRILPAVTPTAPTWAGFRELWVRDGEKHRSYILDEDRDSTTDPLMQAVNRWAKVKIEPDSKGNERNGLYKLDSRFGSYPALKYYVNVVPLDEYVDNNGVPRYKERYTKDGKLDVYMLALNFSLLSSLSTFLQDKMLNPNLLHQQELKEYIAKGYKFNGENLKVESFISDAFAYPVTLTYTAVANSNPTRTLTVDSSDAHILYPLPIGWQSQAEDLAYQTTPSYKYNEHWVSVLINKIDAELGLTSHVEPPKQQTDPFASQKVQVTDNALPTDFGNSNATSQGVQASNGFQTGQSVQTPTDQLNKATQVVPEAPSTQPTAPITPQPSGLTSAVNVDSPTSTAPVNNTANAVDSVFPELDDVLGTEETPSTPSTAPAQPQAQSTPTTPSATATDNTANADTISDEQLNELMDGFDIEGLE